MNNRTNLLYCLGWVLNEQSPPRGRGDELPSSPSLPPRHPLHVLLHVPLHILHPGGRRRLDVTGPHGHLHPDLCRPAHRPVLPDGPGRPLTHPHPVTRFQPGKEKVETILFIKEYLWETFPPSLTL